MPLQIGEISFSTVFLQHLPEKTALVSSVDTAVIEPVQKPGKKNGNSEKLNVQPHLGTALYTNTQ